MTITNKNNLTEKLIKAGHSIKRAKEIIKEAEESSNPEYILNYYGVRYESIFTDR